MKLLEALFGAINNEQYVLQDRFNQLEEEILSETPPQKGSFSKRLIQLELFSSEQFEELLKQHSLHFDNEAQLLLLDVFSQNRWFHFFRETVGSIHIDRSSSLGIDRDRYDILLRNKSFALTS